MFYFLSAHDTSVTDLRGFIPAKNDVEQAELQLLPRWMEPPFKNNFVQLAARITSTEISLNLWFFSHFSSDFLKLRKKEEEEECPDSEEGTNLKMENLKKKIIQTRN